MTAKRPAVLFVTRKWPPAVGGMELYSLELTRELRKHTDLSVHALAGRDNGQPPSALSLMLFGLKAASKLFAESRRYDVIHTGDLALWPLLLVSRVLNRSASLVASVHGTDIAYPLRSGSGPWLYGKYLDLGASLLRQCRLIANSSATAKLCSSRGFSSVVVIPLGVRTHPDRDELPRPSPYILFVGRLVRRKGCGWFIREVLPQLRKELKLIVAGTKWDATESDAIDSDRVEFLGPVYGDELKALRRGAVAVVMPNIECEGRDFEGFGLTAIECAADKGVLIASAVDGIVDAVENGITGFLLPPENPEAWKAKIEEIEAWSHLQRIRHTERAWNQISRDYSWERVARRTLRAYRNPGSLEHEQ